MQHINSFTSGMKRGLDPLLFPQDSYLLLRNGTLMKTNHGFVVGNIKGNKLIRLLNDTEYPIASTSFNGVLYFMTYEKKEVGDSLIRMYYKIENDIVLFTNMRDEDNQIMPFEVPSSLFGYTSNKLVEMIAKESYDGSTDLYLCDGINPNIIINTGIDRNGVIVNRFYPTNPDRNLFYQQKSILKIPDISYSVNANGSLKPGSYFFYIRYEDDSLNPTPFIKEVGPVFIHNKLSGAVNDGSTLDSRIDLKITNIDNNYKYISVAVVYQYGINGVLSRDTFMLDKIYSVAGDTLNVSYNGENPTRSFVLEELFKDNVRDNVSETQTQIDGVMYLGNVSGGYNNNSFLKNIASLIIPYAELKVPSEQDYSDDNYNTIYDNKNNEFEYIEEEMYPLGISFLVDGRYKTDVFPIFGWYQGKTYVDGDTTHENMSYNDLINIIDNSWDVVKNDKQLIKNKILFEIIVNPTTGARNLYFKFEYPMTIWRLEATVRVYSTSGEDWDDITVICDERDGTGETSIMIGELTWGQTLENVDIQFDQYVSCNGYWVNQAGEPDRDGKYSKEMNYYFYYEDKSYPMFPILEVQEYISSTKLDNIEILNKFNNKLGLFAFPLKESLYNEDKQKLHFWLMGLKLDYTYAKQYIESYTGEKPKTIQMYIVQGKRVKNRITQGYSVASVEVVGYNKSYYVRDNDYNYRNETVKQTTFLGSNTNRCAFPLLDGSNVRLFPVAKINRSNTDDADDMDTDKRVFRLEQDSVSQFVVMDNDDNEDLIPNTLVDAIFTTQSSEDEYPVDYLLLEDDYEQRYGSVRTSKFCIFTPDILLDRSLIIKSTYYLKPCISLRDCTKRPKQDLYIPSKANTKIYTVFNSYHKRQATHAVYRDTSMRHLSPLKLDYKTIVDNSIYKVQTSIINENEISSSFNGFSTRMKSVLEVFGDNMNNINSEESPTLTAFFSSSRQECFDAGILLNRTKFTTSDNNKEKPIFMDNDFGGTASVMFYPYQFYKLYPFTNWRENNSLPQIFTNLSMKATPYIGAVTVDENDNHKKGYYGATSNTPNYQNIHNCIVNINTFESFESYKANVLNSYNLLSEMYSLIHNDNFDNNKSQLILKGDCISQKTTMRCIRWSDIPDNTYHNYKDFNFDYGWKQGQAFTLYLQSTTNTLLRVPSKEETFYPFISSNQTQLEEFIWSSSSVEMLKESWSYNDGYSQLLGIFKLPAFDELMLSKINKQLNRIRYSDKHVSGSFVDSYRSFLQNNYQDFAFENGMIMRLIKFNNTLFTIQESGILQHYQSQKIETSGDTSEIILGDKSLLSDSYRQLCEFGTQHKESVEVGDRGIYGIDWNRSVIWRIKPGATSTGAVSFGVEELNVEKSLFNIFDNIKNDYNKNLKQDVYGNPKQGITTVYDEKNKLILFTIHYTEMINDVVTENNKTIVFSELFDTFVAEYDYDCNKYLKHGNMLYTFKKSSHSIEEVGSNELYQKINNEVRPFELHLIINCKSEQDASQFEKEFLSHLVNMNEKILDSVSWETEWQSSIKSPFINENEFWSNPEYVEHNWCFPIIPNTKDPISGPTSTEVFKTFEKDSQMRGQWLILKLKYTGTESLVIKNIITNFIISY